MDATIQDADTAVARDAAPCLRHSYPRDEPKGNRLCRRCSHPENGSGQTEAGSAPSTSAAIDDPTTGVPAVLAPTTPSTVFPAGEHSPLGASSAERWMNCPGSVALTAAIRNGEGYDEEEPDYRRDGVEAHSLAAYCLQENVDCWEAPIDAFPSLTADMMNAVQTYLDFTRSLPGRFRYIEHRMHRPEFHRLAYGTMDFASVSVADEGADFVDYKHGVGVVVDVKANPQLMYYVYLFIGDNADEYPDDMAIRVHVCQPRAEHLDGPIRSWATTAGAIRKWAHDCLRPAMERTINDRYLSVGEWCRFCPAKLICPAMTSLADEITYHRETPLRQFSAEHLGEMYLKAQAVKMFVRAIEDETGQRVLGGEAVPGVKVVAKRSIRVWKDGAPIEQSFGEAAWQPRELVSPAMAEKLPAGKVFVHEWAYQPEGGLTIAPETDRRPALTVKTSAETFGAALAAIAAEAW